MKKTLRNVLYVLIVVSTTVAATPTLEDYARVPTFSKVALSPDGQKIAFRKSDGSKDLLVVYSLKEKKSVYMVDLAEINPEAIYFISDFQVIIRVEDFKWVGDGSPALKFSAAYLLDIKTGKLEQMLRAGDRIYTGQTHLGSIVGITPDGKEALMPAWIDPNVDYSAHYVASSGPFNLALMRVDLSSPNSPKRAEKGFKETIDYFMGKNGKALVQELYYDHKKEHRILVKKGSSWKEIYSEQTPLMTLSSVGLTPDYKNLVVLAYSKKTDRSEYYTLSLKDGSLTKSTVNREDKGVEEVISDVNRVVYGVRYSGFNPSYKLIDDKVDNILQKVLAKFPKDSVFLHAWSKDWKSLLVFVSGPSSSGDYYLINEKGEESFLGSQYPNISQENIHPIANIAVTARDGLKIPTLLTIPRDKVSALKNLPVVIFPHGGPEAHDRIMFDWIAQALANEGYMVVQPQFRGSDGFGWSHLEAGFGEWGNKMQDDITDTLKFLVEKGVADKDKVCIFGLSYGGYAALAGGAFTPELYKCVVSGNGLADIPLFMNEHKSGFYRRYSESRRYIERSVSDAKDKQALEAISPAHHAAQFQAPVLLLYSENDRRVSPDHSKRMFKNLKEAGKKVETVVLEEENHTIDTAAARMAGLKAVIEFINKQLKK